jgi:HNH endonuclease
MTTISKELRAFVTQRARGLCEYCKTAQVIVVEMEIDHIKPESDGGTTTEENLCLACAGCNRFKGSAQTAIDPTTNQTTGLLNPRTQRWRDHFQWSTSGIVVIGISATGRATVEKLKMNRELVVKARQRWVKAGWHPPYD